MTVPLCGELDTQLHRMVWCDATKGVRRECGIGDGEIDLLLSGGEKWASRAVFLWQTEESVLARERRWGTAYLQLLSLENTMEDVRRASESRGEATEMAFVCVGGKQGLSAIILRDAFGVRVWETSGLGKDDAICAALLRLAISANLGGFQSLIRVQ